MPKDMVILGPPGTGKTTSAVGTAKGWFEGGLGTNEVAYLAFTKAAAKEAAGRVMDDDFRKDYGDQLPYFRTLHSLAYMGLRKERDIKILTEPDMKAFAQWSSLEGKYSVMEWEDLSEAYRKLQDRGKDSRTEWDDCLDAYTLSRISAKSAADIEAAKIRPSNAAWAVVGRLDENSYPLFVSKYETYKQTNGLVDFADMLVYALTEMPPVEGVRKVVIDEAQDLSPILWRITDRLFQNAEEIWWAGDDDQSIFRFSAADAAMFIERARRSTQIYLRQTHRFGDEIVNYSKRIISRVSDRVAKDVIGYQGKKHEIKVVGNFSPITDARTLLLHRHVAGCQALARLYVSEGLPFRNERGKNPLGASMRVMAYQALRDLANGKTVMLGSAMQLIDDLMPSFAVDERKKSKVRLVVHGGKKKIKGLSPGSEMNIMDLIRAKILTAEGAEVIRQKFFNVFKYPEDLMYYDRVVENGYDLEGDCPVITTIHGSKGRQADQVVAFSEMGMKCWDDPDSEHRLAYVAATRTERRLLICTEEMLPWNRVTRYDYPAPPKNGSMTPIDTPEE